MMRASLVFPGTCILMGLFMSLAGAEERGLVVDSHSINNEIMTMEEQPKRQAPKPVSPITIKDVRYEVVTRAKARGFGQSGGVIAAVDTKTDRELWTLVVYSTEYDPNEERDVQECYITKLGKTWNKRKLRVDNEANESYMVDLSTREVTKVSQ